MDSATRRPSGAPSGCELTEVVEMSDDLDPELQDLLSATLVGALQKPLNQKQPDLLPRDRKAFEAEIKKDKRFTLPAGSIRPYQLWFGFLKAALPDPELRVDREFYEPWGPVETMTFAQWWPEHWRKLFAIDQSIRVAERLEDVDLRDDVVWVRLPLNKTRGALVTRVGQIVEECQSERKKCTSKGGLGLIVGPMKQDAKSVQLRGSSKTLTTSTCCSGSTRHH
ncbi:MAG: hypothetical protein ACXW06_07320 [Halobacteriota archaeon]